MNTQLHFTRKKNAPDSINLTTFSAILSPEGVAIEVPDMPTANVLWDKTSDVEFLADTFWMLPVWQFRVVVELLEQSNKARHLTEHYTT
jgi:hypothetical protein